MRERERHTHTHTHTHTDLIVSTHKGAKSRTSSSLTYIVYKCTHKVRIANTNLASYTYNGYVLGVPCMTHNPFIQFLLESNRHSFPLVYTHCLAYDPSQTTSLLYTFKRCHTENMYWIPPGFIMYERGNPTPPVFKIWRTFFSLTFGKMIHPSRCVWQGN